MIRGAYGSSEKPEYWKNEYYKACAEIERLEKDVERLRGVVRKRTEEADDADYRAYTAWNDAIEAAAEAVSNLKTPTSEEVMEGHEQAYRAIESLKLCKP